MWFFLISTIGFHNASNITRKIGFKEPEGGITTNELLNTIFPLNSSTGGGGEAEGLPNIADLKSPIFRLCLLLDSLELETGKFIASLKVMLEC